MRRGFAAAVVIAGVVAGAGPLDSASATGQNETTIIDLWSAGTATFGVFVPDERPGAARGREQGGRGQGLRGQGGRGQRQPPLYTVEGGER
ncbi:MAG: hypothetical protein IH849_15425, partial [Acidobacteria bacterium]|nr:hypothetical protein [Acidobacteriota bacterium]